MELMTTRALRFNEARTTERFRLLLLSTLLLPHYLYSVRWEEGDSGS